MHFKRETVDYIGEIGMSEQNIIGYDKSKISWSCRRGMLELDKILMNFFETEFDNLSEVKKQAFVDLLEHNDTELQSWLIGENLPTEHELQDLVLCIRHLAIVDYT